MSDKYFKAAVRVVDMNAPAVDAERQHDYGLAASGQIVLRAGQQIANLAREMDRQDIEAIKKQIDIIKSECTAMAANVKLVKPIGER